MTPTITGIVTNGVIVPDSPLPEGARVEIQVKPERVSSELGKRFRELAKQWNEGTAHLSSIARMAKHPAYREIIQMGPPVVPLLLAELRRDPDFWFAALREITGENPVPARSAGKVKEMARAWIEWGPEAGIHCVTKKLPLHLANARLARRPPLWQPLANRPPVFRRKSAESWVLDLTDRARVSRTGNSGCVSPSFAPRRNTSRDRQGA